ncbi:hypothetical protein OUZ56_030759 [Daphnia magna]|uniref:Uncharacterized protein n=1 Tax=Daphnia magna TaxID=35525 RepID=A0ABQ9ZSN2_9CRUS|nr:hypothetical protein OUZ56_030759 [Daphnia magna]
MDSNWAILIRNENNSNFRWWRRIVGWKKGRSSVIYSIAIDLISSHDFRSGGESNSGSHSARQFTARN